MRLTKKHNGYTIVETLIVLAVTGAMLTTTVLLISGQMSRYRFREVTLNSQQFVQDAINDVQVGYFDIIPDASGVTGISCTEEDAALSGDSSCVYVGKEIEITASGTIILTPLVLQDGQKPGPSVTPVKLSSYAITKIMPGGVDYQPTTFWVLYVNYPDTTNPDFVGGTQSVNIYGSSKMDPVPSPGYYITCIKSDNRQAYLTIGENKSLNVKLAVESCPTP